MKYLILLTTIFLQANLYAQEFDLLDSLVERSQLPIVTSSGLNTNAKKDGSIYSLNSSYEFDLKSYDGDCRTLYAVILKKGDSLKSEYKNIEWTGYDKIVQVPLVHPILYYAQSKVIGDKVKVFSVSSYVKNAGDLLWETKDCEIKIDLSSSKGLVTTTACDLSSHKLTKHQGEISTIMFDLDMDMKIKSWSHVTPNLYRYSYYFKNKFTGISELFTEKIGFRRVQLINRDLLVNGRSTILKPVSLSSMDIIDKDSLYEHLRQIRISNINTIFLKNQAPKYLFDLCDSLGIYIIQQISHDTFSSLSQLLLYFVERKESPSLIGWKYDDTDKPWINILKRIDPSRIFTEETLFPRNLINNWFDKDEFERNQIRTKFQPFHTVFNLTNSHLQIISDDPFQHLNSFNLTWSLEYNGNEIETGSSQNLKFNKDILEIELAIKSQEYRKADLTLKYKITPSDDSFVFGSNDPILIDQFELKNVSNSTTITR